MFKKCKHDFELIHTERFDPILGIEFENLRGQHGINIANRMLNRGIIQTFKCKKCNKIEIGRVFF